VRSFGFPSQAPPDGHYGYGVAGDLLAVAGGGVVLQLTSANDLTRGFSGAPILDEVTELVVGMVTAITAPDEHRRGVSIAYATPTEALREVWPELAVSDVSPYRGLEPFTADDARWFHGRDRAVEQVLAALAAHRLVLLLGPSGAGKSSLVQAGVVPALAAGRLAGADRWLPVLARPGQDLLAELNRAGLPDIAGGIAASAARRVADEPTRDRLLLIIDQFEELLTQARPGQHPTNTQAAAIDQLTASADTPGPLTAVLVMRDDFYPRLAALAPQLLEAAGPGLLNMPATLGTQDLHAIITRPADAAGGRYEQGLAERITTDVLAVDHTTTPAREAPVTVLPLLELTLSQLWRDRRDGLLTHDAYQRIGEVSGSLATWCDTALDQLQARHRPVARQILTALVRPADDTHHIPATRQQLPLNVLRDLAGTTHTTTDSAGAGAEARAGQPAGQDAADEVLGALTRHRIITTRTIGTSRPADLSKPPVAGEPVAELVHDALIHDWATLRDWVNQDHQFQDWLRRAREQHDRWAGHREPGDLLHGTDLAEGLDWSQQRRLPGSIATFLAASHHRQRATTRRARRLNTILAALLVVALAAASVALVQRRTAITAEQVATTAERVATSRQLAARSETLLATNPDLASLLAIHAYRISQTPEAMASVAAAAALPLQRSFPGETAAFSPDGTTLATTKIDEIRLWDTATGELRDTLVDPVGGGYAEAPAAFSPDGHILAEARHDGTVQLWDLTTNHDEPRILTGPPNEVGWPVPPAAFSPDGTLLANANFDGTVQLWNLTTGQDRSIRGTPRFAASMAFSPDGTTLATGSTSDGNAVVRLWDTRTGQPKGAPPSDDNGDVRSFVFSPDGNTLAIATTTATDVTVRLWNIAAGETTRTGVDELDTNVDSATVSPDLRTLATGSTSGSVRLWDITTGVALATLPGYPSSTSSFSPVPPVFSPDGATLATSAAEDRVIDAEGTYREVGVVRLWDIPIGKPLGGQTSLFPRMGFSPDGTTLASVRISVTDATTEEATLNLWDIDTGESIDHHLPGLPPPSSAVGLGPDRNILATTDGTVDLWDIDTGQPIDQSMTSEVASLGFGPDGTTLATTRPNGQVDLWDIAPLELQATLRSEADDWSPDLPPVFSHDGTTLAATTESDGTVWTWDLSTGESQPPIVTGDDSNAVWVALSPDGTTLATTGENGAVRLWDSATGRPLITLPGHTGPVYSAAFSPDGTTLATAGQDRTVRLWDTSTGRTLTTLGHTGPVYSAAFSPDGTTLATTTIDGDILLGDDLVPQGTLELWDAPTLAEPADALRKICRADSGAHPRLTPEEEDQYLPPDQEHDPACPAR
jgi:WD40 repeat protein